jgi:hypothetical protein
MTSTLHPDFLRAVVIVTGFKPEPMRRAQAALLYCALQGCDFTAAVLPGEITNGSRHIAGAATGSLVAIGLLTVVRREPSPDKSAKGRKLDVLRAGSVERIRAWLRANRFADTVTTDPQTELFPELQPAPCA